jgi:hypothetical protein
MCFNQTWAGSAFVILIGTAIVAGATGMDWRIPAGLSFLATKEAIQFLLYNHLEKDADGKCDRMNEILTVLAWIHISFQPFFVLLFIQGFSRSPQWYNIPLGMAMVFAVFNILRIKEDIQTDRCVPKENPKGLCKKETCSFAGKYHVAYGFNLQSGDRGMATPNIFTYYLLSFVPPLIVGDWPIPLASALLAILSYGWIAPHDNGEAAAIWCLISVAFVGFVAWSLFTGRKYLV